MIRKKIESEKKNVLIRTDTESNWVKAEGMKGDSCCDSCHEWKRHTSAKLETFFASLQTESISCTTLWKNHLSLSYVWYRKRFVTKMSILQLRVIGYLCIMVNEI